MNTCRTSGGRVGRNETVRVRRAVISRWKQQRGCKRCGNKSLYGYQLDLNHIDPYNKSFSISSSGNLKRNWNRIKDEISKCEVLCKNCHAYISYTEKHYTIKK